MTRRHGPEDFDGDDNDAPLFASVDAARAKGHAAAGHAASKAARIEPGWKQAALETVRSFALRTENFLSEHVPFEIPLGADRRALGSIMKEAERLGYIRADGAAPAVSSNSSLKTRWRSLIFRAPAHSDADARSRRG